MVRVFYSRNSKAVNVCGVYAHVCEYLWGPETNIRPFPQLFSTWFPEVSLTETTPYKLAGLSGLHVPGSLLSASPRWCRERHTATPGFLMWVLEGTLGLACACSKCVTRGASTQLNFPHVWKEETEIPRCKAACPRLYRGSLQKETPTRC